MYVTRTGLAATFGATAFVYVGGSIGALLVLGVAWKLVRA